MNIPEQAVEAAAKIIYRTSGRKRVMRYEEARKACEAEARELLEAAAPYMMAAAWDRAAASIVDEHGNPVVPTNVHNPYRASGC